MSRCTLRPRHDGPGHPEYVGDLTLAAVHDVALFLNCPDKELVERFMREANPVIKVTGSRLLPERVPLPEPPPRPPSKRLRKALSVDLDSYRGGDIYGNKKR